MYQLWLYKNIETANGIVSLEVKKRDYNGRAIEIDDIAVDSIILSMDGDSITDPIIGTSLSFGIIDTGQIDTEQFFTPDATLYSVQLSIDGTVAWVGYLTPDSYTESLAYRDIINLTARDNLGRLNDFTFTQAQGLQNVVTFIESLVAEVGCSQYLNWNCNKYSLKKGEGIDAITSIQGMYVNTELFIGKTYREIVEEILRGLGCQMRYIGNNNLMILSLSDLSTIEAQDAIFINSSGVKEILPAWRNLTVEQDYGLVENFFDGYINEKESGSFTFYKPSEQMPTKWDGDLYFANQYGWNTGIEDNQSESIYPALQDVGSKKSAIYRKSVKATNTMVTLSIQCNNTLRWLRDDIYRKVSNLYVGGEGRQEYTLSYSFNIYLRSQNKTYLMLKDGWVDMDSVPKPIPIPILFIMPKCVNEDQGTWNQEQEVKIEIASIPYDGELLVEIHRVFWAETDSVSDYMYYGKIRDITLAFSNSIGAVSALAQVNAKHNIDQSLQLKLGQVPSGKGDALAYAGGYYSIDGLPLSYYQRTDNEELAYNLMELVAREHIHLNNNNYSLLSGQMIGQNGNAISFGCNIRHNELYCIISASIAVISGTLDVTKMQEVTPYQVAELTIIDSPLELSSGSKVGSGNNEVIQFSNDAGNAKRLYELDQASQEDMEDSYVIIDKYSMSAAKRVPFKDVGGLFNKAFRLHYNEDGVLVSVEVLANLWTNFGITAGGEGTGSGGGTGGATSLEGLNDVSLAALVDGQSLVWSSTLSKWINKTIESGLDEDALSDYLMANNYAVKGDIPSELKSPYKLSFGDKSYDGSAEVTITAADLGALTEHQSLDGYVNTIETTGNGNAVTSVVKNGKKLTFTKGATYLTTHQDISHLLSKEEAADTYQVKGNYLTGITSKMVTDVLGYTPLANTTKYALSDSVGGNALDSAKFGGQLPAYYATATSVTKVADDLSTFKTLFDSMFEKKDGKIHAKLTLWTDYALVAGGEGDGTGGGGGGLTAFSVIINNKTYNSDNGVATITEQLQPLITASNKLDYSLISGTPTSLPASDVYAWAKNATLAASDVPNLDWSKITSGKPTTLAGYGITDALPLSGGVLSGNLAFKGNNWYLEAQTIIFRNASTTADYGTQIINAWNAGETRLILNKDNAYFRDVNGNNNTLIHSGNIERQSVASAGVLKISTNQDPDASEKGQMFSTSYNTGIPSGGSSYLNGLTFASNNDSAYKVQIGIDYYGKVFSRSQRGGVWYTWKQLAFTDSDITGNAATATRARYIETQAYDGSKWYADEYRLYAKWVNSNILGLEVEGGYPIRVNQATKLATARTIWGQSFDGTGNVNGKLTIGTESATLSNIPYIYLWKGDGTYMHRGLLGVHEGGATFDYYNPNVGIYRILCIGPDGLTYGNNTSSNKAFIINSSGNVTIGASDLAGSNRKLYVNGKLTATRGKFGNIHINEGHGSYVGESTIETSDKGMLYINYYHNGGLNLCQGGGNVGIGTTEPSAKLDVNGDILAKGYLYVKDYVNSNTYKFTFLQNEGITRMYNYSSSAGAYGDMYIGRNSGDAIVIKSNGNVLIGTTTDNAYKLQVAGSAYVDGSINLNLHGITNVSSISCHDSGIGYFVGGRNYGLGVTDGGALIYSYGNTPISFYTKSNERMRITGDGNIGIGTTSPRHKLEVQGNISIGAENAADTTQKYLYFWLGDGSYRHRGLMGVNGGGAFWNYYCPDTGAYKEILINSTGVTINGNISASGAVTAGDASDIRLKDNIQTIDQNKAIKILMALNPITYQWNDKARDLGGYEGISQGFIAQEYESVIPNSGRAIWGEYRAIDYTKAIPFVVSVAQNHEQRIRQLEEELNRLRREYYGI